MVGDPNIPWAGPLPSTSPTLVLQKTETNDTKTRSFQALR